jgi:hypothetical protein
MTQEWITDSDAVTKLLDLYSAAISVADGHDCVINSGLTHETFKRHLEGPLYALRKTLLAIDPTGEDQG